MVKNLSIMQETWVQLLSQEHPLEMGMASHTSILAWEIPRTEEPGLCSGKESDTGEQLTFLTHLPEPTSRGNVNDSKAWGTLQKRKRVLRRWEAAEGVCLQVWEGSSGREGGWTGGQGAGAWQIGGNRRRQLLSSQRARRRCWTGELREGTGQFTCPKEK